MMMNDLFESDIVDELHDLYGVSGDPLIGRAATEYAIVRSISKQLYESLLDLSSRCGVDVENNDGIFWFEYFFGKTV